MMRFVIDGQKLRLLGNPYIVGNSHDYLTASFQFFSDPDWEATEKHVFFKLGANNPYEIILIDDTISKDKHLNLSDGIWSIYVIGYDINDGTLVERIPTNKVSLLVEESGIEEGEPFPDVGGSTGEQILASEQDRIDQELTRVAAEGVRVASEQGRVTEEQNRVVAEQGRGTAEGLRVTAESGRDSAEGLRDTAEQGRDTAEGLRDSAEQSRDSAEDSRIAAESARAFYATYDAATSYILGNKVSYNGSSYIWIDDDPSVAGTQPPSTGWLLIASRGEDGTDGTSGVYVGSDPIPEGYNVQIDPDGDATDVVLQFSTMPTADVDYLGVTVLYTGVTGTYKNGGTYICVASEDVIPVYSWSRVGEDVSGAISDHNTDGGAHAILARKTETMRLLISRTIGAGEKVSAITWTQDDAGNALDLIDAEIRINVPENSVTVGSNAFVICRLNGLTGEADYYTGIGGAFASFTRVALFRTTYGINNATFVRCNNKLLSYVNYLSYDGTTLTKGLTSGVVVPQIDTVTSIYLATISATYFPAGTTIEIYGRTA